MHHYETGNVLRAEREALRRNGAAPPDVDRCRICGCVIRFNLAIRREAYSQGRRSHVCEP